MRSIKKMDKRLDEREQEIERLNKIVDKLEQDYIYEYNLRHRLSLELSIEKDKVLGLEEVIRKVRVYIKGQIKYMPDNGCKLRLKTILKLLDKEVNNDEKSSNREE